MNHDPIAALYEQIGNTTPLVCEENKVDKNDFRIKTVKIYVKQGDNNPELRYIGNVIDYDQGEHITTIHTETRDGRRMILKRDKNNNVDVTVLDHNNNIQDEFNINGMQLNDIDNPDELSFLKIEQAS